METGGGFFGFGDYGEWSVSSAGSSAAAAATSWSLLPFGSAAPAHSLTDTLFLSSPSSSFAGGMMGNNARAVFTMAQREELERQTLIFKYMVASIPIPSQLLLAMKPSIPIGSNRYSTSSSLDPEPWRCKRTDGKKWRCSRDVAPHQKYCERHSHKSRPRSRKPVEFLSSNPDSKLRVPSRESTTISSPVTDHVSLSHLTPYHSQKEFSHAAGSATPRSLEWLMKGEVISVPQPHLDQLQWQHRPLSNYRPDHELQVQVGASGLTNDQCSLLIGMATLEGQGAPKGTSALSKRVPTSSPSLAMFGEGEDDRRESIGRIGLAVAPSCVGGAADCNQRSAQLKPHWMSPGGPLAEALCLSTTEQAMESCIHVINPDS